MDLDDMLGDLLAEGPKPKKATQKPSGGKTAAKPVTLDDDFYSSMAADISDVSDADPDEMAKSLADLDDMDAALFGTKKSPPTAQSKSGQSTSPKKSAASEQSKAGKSTGGGDDSWLFGDSFGGESPKKTASLSKPGTADVLTLSNTAPARSSSSKGLFDDEAPAKSKPTPKKKFSDFDDDDPLAGLLSDEEDLPKPKAKQQAKKAPVVQKQDSYDDDSSQGSRRLEIERPPTRSGKHTPETDNKPVAKKPAPRRKDDDIMFDDDDVLGGMGLDSPRRKSPMSSTAPARGHSAPAAPDDAPRPGGARSIMDDLLGTTDVSKMMERPGTGDNAFSPDKKAATLPRAKEKDDDEFAFGSYMPTAGTSSRPNSRRSVRFENEEDIFSDVAPSRGSSAGRKRGPASYMEQMVDNDDRDWLDIAGGGVTKKEKPKDDKRPSSEGSMREKTNLNATADTTASEPVDWLGLARLGSPDVTPRSPDPMKSVGPEFDAKPAKKPAVSKPPADEEDEEFLPFPKAKAKTTPAKAAPAATAKSPAQKSPAQKSPDKGGDWLGLDDKQDDGADWLGIKPSKSDSKDDDYLGLGADVDPDEIFKKPNLKKDPEELFAAPKSHMSASLPWDSERPRGRRDRSPGGAMNRSSSAEPPAASNTTPEGAGAGSGDALVPAANQVAGPSISQNIPSPNQASALEFGMSAALPPPGPSSPTRQRDAVRESLFGPSSLFSDTLKEQEDDTRQRAQQQQQQQQQLFQQQQHQQLQQQQAQQMHQQLQQQQQQMVQQQQLAQQQQQVELQRQLKLQQDQQMAALKQQHEQQLMSRQRAALAQSAQFGAPALSMPSLGTPALGMMGLSTGMYGEDFESKAKKLELEKSHLQSLLDTSRGQHQEDLRLLEDSYKKRIEMFEDMWQKRESRLRDENEYLSTQSQQRLRRLEQDKEEMMKTNIQQHERWEAARNDEIVKMRQIHNAALEELRNEHKLALESVNKAKTQELAAAVNASDHARHLQAVISRVEDHASNLDDLQQKVQGQHMTHLGERETEIRAKDTYVKDMQERLERQQHETEKERARLQALVTKLEVQLTEQTRQTEEEKWRVRQEEGRLRSLQQSLEQERSLLTEQVERDRTEVEKAKSALLEEQRSVLMQLASERRALSEERAQFSVNQRLKNDQEMKDSVKLKTDELELENSIRFINSEKSRLAEEARQLEVRMGQLQASSDKVDQQSRLHTVEKEKLEQLAIQVNQKSAEIQEMCQMAAQARDQGQSALANAQQQSSELTMKAEHVQKQTAMLRDKERQIAEERLALAREKQELEKERGGFICINCRTPVRDINNVQQAPQPHPLSRMTPAAQGLYSALPRDIQGQVQSDTMTNIISAIHTDKHIRLWRKSAQKDNQFLTEESVFLQALQKTPYHSQDQPTQGPGS